MTHQYNAWVYPPSRADTRLRSVLDRSRVPRTTSRHRDRRRAGCRRRRARSTPGRPRVSACSSGSSQRQGIRASATSPTSCSPTSTSITQARPAARPAAIPRAGAGARARRAAHGGSRRSCCRAPPGSTADRMDRLWGEVLPVPVRQPDGLDRRRDGAGRRAGLRRGIHARTRVAPRQLFRRVERRGLRRRHGRGVVSTAATCCRQRRRRTSTSTSGPRASRASSGGRRPRSS